MKLLFILFILFVNPTCFSQGKFAGSKANMVGVNYADSRNIPGLEGWTFREGSMISPIDNPETIVVDVYQKGATYLVLFSINSDTSTTNFQIADVLEIKTVPKSQYIKTGLCRQNKNDDMEIVALIKPGHSEYVKALKAWRFNRDKKRIELIVVKDIDCLNEMFDQS